MEQKNTRLRNVGFITFFFSGICAISSGVVVSLLQEQHGDEKACQQVADAHERQQGSGHAVGEAILLLQ